MASRHNSKHDTTDPTKQDVEATGTSPSHSSATESVIPAATDAVSPRTRQITACETPNSIFVIHQDEKGNLLMRGYYAKLETWLETKRLNTTIPATMNTPLSSTCWPWSDYTDIRVYYLAEEDESYSQICARCPIDGSACYAFDYTSNDAVKPSKNGGIAMTSPQPYQLKFYGLGEDGTIMEHTWDQQESFAQWVPAEGLPKAHKNSPLAVDMNYDELNLMWFDQDHNLLTSQASLKSSGEVVSWSSARNITDGKASVLPLGLGLAVSEDPNVFQAFYLEDSEFAYLIRANDRWGEGSIPASVPHSTLDQGPIAAVGWNNTSVRLYYFVDENIVELLYEPSLGWKQGDF